MHIAFRLTLGWILIICYLVLLLFILSVFIYYGIKLIIELKKNRITILPINNKEKITE